MVRRAGQSLAAEIRQRFARFCRRLRLFFSAGLCWSTAAAAPRYSDYAPKGHLRVPNIMKRTCAVTILAQNAKQDMPLSHSKQVACDNVMGQNSCQPEGLHPESALASLLVLTIE